MPSRAHTRPEPDRPAGSPRRRSGGFWWLVRLAVAVGIFAIVANVVGRQNIVQALSRAELALVGLGWGLGLGIRLLDAFQLRVVMRRAGLRVGLFRVLAANGLSVFYGLVVPGDLLAGAAKWWNLSAATRSGSGVLNALIYNRILVLLSWILAGAAALAWNDPWSVPGLRPAALAAGVLIAAAVTAFYHPRTGPWFDQRLRNLGRRLLPEWFEARIESVLASLQAFRRFPWRFHAGVFGLAIFNLACLMGVFVILAASVGIDAPLSLLVWTLSVLLILRHLPITLSGIGVREATLVGVLGGFGVSSGAAFGLALLMFAGVMLFALVGAFYTAALALGLATWRPIDAAGEAADS